MLSEFLSLKLLFAGKIATATAHNAVAHDVWSSVFIDPKNEATPSGMLM